MMMIQNISINEIKFDPTQPRKYIDEEKVQGMAQSMKEQGVINPIEIDGDYVIVTGELRYRAAKEAGLETIPCKVIEITKKNRFERQVVENIHHNTMSAWDTAVALDKLLSTAYVVRSQGKDFGIRKLADKIGKGEKWIRDELDLLLTDKKTQNALKENKVSKSQIRSTKSEDKELQGKLEKFVLKNPEVGSKVVGKIRQAIHENPDKEEQILKQKYKDVNVERAQKIIENIAPTVEDKARDINFYFEDIESAVNRLVKLINNPPEKVVAKGGLIEFNAKVAMIKLIDLSNKLQLIFNQQQNARLESNTTES